MDVTSITNLQNRDGGWPYRKGGGSSTEPTVLALLAQSVDPGDPQSTERGLAWLRATQRQDGGWPPQPQVPQSTWVTALVALMPRDALGASRYARAIDWLMGQTGKEASLAYKLRNELLGEGGGVIGKHEGWPFFPGAAAWVTPSAISILSLEKARRYQMAGGIQQRIEIGRQFLMDRVCQDGGWNYGRANVLGVEADSYPETTGQALLALHGAPPSKLEKSLAAAQAQARRCQSAEGLSWLQLGLQAHGITAAGPAHVFPYRHVADTSLGILARAALRGRNLFLE
jgi:hypothetical protein